MSSRKYSAGCEKALFMLSRGHCYEPSCQTRVMRFANDDWEVKVEIAHIRGLHKGSARYEESMSDPERNHFRNLILLCETHHKIVDRKENLATFTVQVLTGWKQAVEGDLSDELDEIDWLTQGRLQNLMASAVTDTHDAITTALDHVKGIGQETILLLKSLVAEAFNKPYIDAETVASLESSARAFAHLPQSAEMLGYSADSLRRLPDSADMLMYASDALRRLPESAESLFYAATQLQSFNYQLSETLNRIDRLQEGNSQLDAAAGRIEAAHGSTQQLITASSQIVNMSDTATALENAAMQAATAAANINRSGDWSWRAFRHGMVWCFAAIVVLLGMYSWAQSQT